MKYLLLLLIVFFTTTVHANPCSDMVHTPGFIANNYLFIAREPDSDKTFSGKMSVENLKDKNVKVIESVNAKPARIWLGQFRPAAPGEGCVLSLESKQEQMSCLVNVDLDNTARLTCRWGNKTKSTKTPGLMALFPE